MFAQSHRCRCLLTRLVQPAYRTVGFSPLCTTSSKLAAVEHLNQEKPVIRIPYYYKESRTEIKRNVDKEELNLIEKLQLQGNKGVPIIVCRSGKLSHFKGQRYKPGRMTMATYRWAHADSAGQDFKFKAYARLNKMFKAHERDPSLLSGHVEQLFIRSAQHERPQLLLRTLESKLAKPSEVVDGKAHAIIKSPSFVLIYCRKMSTAAYLEHYLRSERLTSRYLKASLASSQQTNHLKEMIATGCRILIRTNELDSDRVHIDDCPVQHIINYDCPESVEHYDRVLDDLFQGEFCRGDIRTMTTFVRFKLEAKMVQEIEMMIRTNL